MTFAFPKLAFSHPASLAITCSTLAMGLAIGIQVPGWADASPLSQAAALYPLETREMEIEPDETRPDQVASQINRSLRGDAETEPDILDALGSPELEALIDDFVDENGDVNLPLGLTVYDTMGDPSIGFGGRF